MQHAIVSQSERLAVHKALLGKEKVFTKQRDALSAARRALPWVKVDKNYVFNGPQGKETLAELFGGKSQLMIYHFMLGPGAGLPELFLSGRSFRRRDPAPRPRDVAFVVVSSAPLAESRPTRSAWAGRSNGCRPTALTFMRRQRHRGAAAAANSVTAIGKGSDRP